MATTGWVAKTVPPVAPDGLVLKPSFAAGQKMSNGRLTAALRPAAVAVRVYVPALLILQLENVAMPDDVLLGFLEQLSVAPPVGGVMVSVTDAGLLVRVLPPASWIATFGCVPKEVLTALVEGLMVKPSRVAGPTVIVKLVLRALVSPVEVAVRV
jgi:hypothetical protein